MKNPKEHITFSVPGKKRSVPIFIGKGVFEKISSIVPFTKYSSVLAIVDENVSQYWSEQIYKVLGKDACYLAIPPGEKNKTLSTVEKIWTTLSENGFDRKSLVINIGGGMVCDVGAFAASTYMRGIDFVQVPTTLLAQADAAIGGKTGFNFNQLKNTIGTFSAPVAVISDTSFLWTLRKREYHSGFAEIIKHALIADEKLFDSLSGKDITSLGNKKIAELLSQSTNIKCSIVEKDPFEKKERKMLNFGHTVGHAVEMSCQTLLHGEAVAIGMIAEAKMSLLSGDLVEKKFKKIENLILKTGLPNKVDATYKKQIAQKMLFDKKNINKQIKWVFLEDIGKVKVDVTLPEEIIEQGLNYIVK